MIDKQARRGSNNQPLKYGLAKPATTLIVELTKQAIALTIEVVKRVTCQIKISFFMLLRINTQLCGSVHEAMMANWLFGVVRLDFHINTFSWENPFNILPSLSLDGIERNETDTCDLGIITTIYSDNFPVIFWYFYFSPS